MPVELPDLPFLPGSLQPHLSAEAVNRRQGIHRACVERVNATIAGTDLEHAGLVGILRHAQGKLFEAAAQAWNLGFQWQCLTSPRAGVEPGDALGELIARHFGDSNRLREEFNRMALSTDAPGWAWLVQHPDGTIGVVRSLHAATPLTGPGNPLLACDLWEHAYQTDYQQDRARYLDGFWKLVNWTFVASRLR